MLNRDQAKIRADNTNCLPACNSYNFHVETLHVSICKTNFQRICFFQYMKEEDDYQDKLRVQLKLKDDIEIG